MVLDGKADQAILRARESRSVALQRLPGVRHSLRVVFPHKSKTLDDSVLNGATGQQRDIHVGRAFQAEPPARQHSERTQRARASELAQQSIAE
jgi:hypothetical protein